MANDSPVVILYGDDGLGGYVEKGTATHPVRVDPTGTTTQPTEDTASSATGAAVPANAMLVGLDDGTNLVAMQADEDGRAKVNVGGVGTGGFYPDYYDAQPGPGNHEPGVQLFDSSGNAKVRAATLTDEGSIRDDFPGTSLDTNCTGTATFTNGSYDVVGVGTAFTTELSRYYMVRRTGDNASYAVRISDVVDDTHLVLAEPYAGTTGSAVPIKSVWSTILGAGGSLAVASSVLTIGSGTTLSSKTYALRTVDYGPLVCNFYAQISQRITGQEILLGLIDSASISQQAQIVFDGTDNTKLKLRTGNSGSVSDIETSASTTMPLAATTAAYHWYRLEFTSDSVSVYVDGVFCVQNKVHIPNFYAPLGMTMGISNIGTPASNTNLLVDVASTNNFNLLQVGGGAIATPTAVAVGGNDAGTYRNNSTKSANVAPNSTEYGQVVRPVPLTTSTTTVAQVASSATVVTLLAANTARMGATIFNQSTSVCYVKLGSGASATSYTVRMSANAYYEVPFGYTGIITGIWAAVNGNAYVTELTL
jgi:hypothetical protein